MLLAAVQLISTPDIAKNLAVIEQQLAGLRQQAAKQELLVVLPECCLLFATEECKVRQLAEPAGKGPMQQALARLAQKYQLYLVAGTIPLQADDDRCFAACLLFEPSGKVLAQYNKIHLFDVDVADGIGAYRESDNTHPGQQLSVVNTPFGRIGLAVCYDVRFSALFGAMTELGVDIIVLPSAFTKPTGQAHWEVLLRARAIESQCYMVAAAQGGVHINNRETWGHSMIVNPWGEIIAQLPRGVGTIYGIYDKKLLASVRNKMPMRQQQRFAAASLISK